MLPKLVFIVSCLYYVQATFVVNAHDDGDDGIANAAATTQTVRSCGYAECNQFCRKLGFMRGVCIGTYCQCRNFRSRDVVMRPGIPNKDLVTIEDNSVSFDADVSDSKSEAVQKLAACDEEVCNRYCRTWRYDRGICVISRCRCLGRPIWFRDNDGSAPHNAINEEASDVQNANDVNTELLSSDEIVEPSIPMAAVRRCSLGTCFTSCRRRGFSGGGMCIGSICRCRAYTGRQLNLRGDNAAEIASNESGDVISGNVPSEIDSGNDDESENETTDRKCIDAEGANPEQTLSQNNSAAKDRASAGTCINYFCNLDCQHRGYPRGICYGVYCQCTFMEPRQRPSGEDLAEDGYLEQRSSEVNSETVSDVSSRACCSLSCGRRCQWSGFDCGVCVYPCKCECRYKSQCPRGFGVAKEAVEPRHQRSCNPRLCEQNCRRIGLRGTCVNGRCMCGSLRSAIPDPPQQPLSEEAAPQPLSDCNWVWCEQTCRRIGFPGGACSNGRCKCDILRSQRPPLIPVPGDD